MMGRDEKSVDPHQPEIEERWERACVESPGLLTLNPLPLKGITLALLKQWSGGMAEPFKSASPSRALRRVLDPCQN